MKLKVAFAASIALLLPACATPHAKQPAIAITVDDLPLHGPTPRGETAVSVAQGVISALTAEHVPAYGFINGHWTVDDPATAPVLTMWRAAGLPLGNHGWSHRHLSEMTPAEFEQEFVRNEPLLQTGSEDWHWFRYPFLDEGQEDKAKRDAVRAGLRARGLHNGYATVDGSDWYIESLTADAVKAGKKVDMAVLRDLYVSTMVGAADFADRLSLKTWGRPPAQVIVLHETDIAALFIADLVRALRADGWTIVTADEAYADPIAKLAPDVQSANGTLLELAAWEKGVPPPRWYERNDMALAKRLFTEQVLHEELPVPTK